MSSVSEDWKCKRCGFDFGCRNYDCRTGEWEFDCCRCGFQEYLEAIVNEDGDPIGWRRELIRAFGAEFITPTGVGASRFCGLRSAAEIERAALAVSEGISSGTLAPKSYVTQWDDDTKTIHVIAGKWTEPEAS